MPLISNSTKVSLSTVNFCEQEKISRESTITVLSYNYSLERAIDAYGVVNAVSSGATQEIRIRVGSKDKLNLFYERLKQEEPSPFSFFFNPVFDETGYLKYWEGAMVVEGYVTALDELYDKYLSDVTGDQMTLSIKVLIKKITYFGENNLLVRDF